MYGLMRDGSWMVFIEKMVFDYLNKSNYKKEKNRAYTTKRKLIEGR